MIYEAKKIKENAPGTIVIGSGVDVQINWKLYGKTAHLIIYSRQIDSATLKTLLNALHLTKESQTRQSG